MTNTDHLPGRTTALLHAWVDAQHELMSATRAIAMAEDVVEHHYSTAAHEQLDKARDRFDTAVEREAIAEEAFRIRYCQQLTRSPAVNA